MKKSLVVILILALVLIPASLVFAEGEHTFNATMLVDGASEKTIDPGDEITISFDISNIDMGEHGINTVEATLDYDPDSFEAVSSSDISSASNWSTTFNSANGKLLCVNFSGGIKDDTDLFTLSMKAKTTLTATAASEIKLVDVTSNDGDSLISVGTKRVGVTIDVPVQEQPTNEIVDNSINTNVEEETPVTPESTQAPMPIPQTGISPVVVIVIAVSLGLIVITCVRYKVISKDVK